MKKTSASFDDLLIEKLRDDKFAAAYLKEHLHDDDPRLFFVALRQVAKSRSIPFNHLAKQARVNRESLYTALSSEGNPSYLTLKTVIEIMGFELDIKLKRPSKNKPLSA